jgi:hypothetical protein
LNYLKGNVSLNAQYAEIEKIAKKFFYNGDFGTLPFFIRSIMKKAYGARIAKAAYLKCVGFNQHTIMNLIDKNIPVILSVFNDGRSFYVSHSITIVGYKTFNINGKILCFFMVYDNWAKTISYVDYEVLSPVSSINYYK